MIDSEEDIIKFFNKPIDTINSKYLKYYINENFFENINDEFKSYILGLMYADGNIEKDKAMRLSLIDKEILESVKYVMQSSHPISSRNTTKQNGENGKNIYKITISNKKIVEDLLENILKYSHEKKDNIVNFIDYIYKDSTIFLPRKAIKFNDYLNKKNIKGKENVME